MFKTRVWSNRAMAPQEIPGETRHVRVNSGETGVWIEPSKDGQSLRVWMTNGEGKRFYQRLLGEIRPVGLEVPAFFPGEHLDDGMVVNGETAKEEQ